MATKTGLSRDSGPGGRAVVNETDYLVAGWELFEGDPRNPNMCRGWFRCEDATFPAKKGTRLSLDLVTNEHDVRSLDVTIFHKGSTEPLWEFVADR